MGRLHPDVRRIDSSVNLQADLRPGGAQNFCISYVMIDERAYLFAAFGQIQRFRAALHRITHAVRFRAPTPMPEWMQWQTAAVFRAGKQRFGHDSETAANASETTVLGKAAQFDCAFECTRNFENGMRNSRLRDIRLVSRVEEQQRLMFPRILDPPHPCPARRR